MGCHAVGCCPVDSGFGIMASRPNQILSSVGTREGGQIPAGTEKGRSQEILRSPGIVGEQGD